MTDCPLRDAPFSIDSALIDIVLSPPAKAAANAELGGMLDKLPPVFAGTKPPNFGSIMTIKEMRRFAPQANFDLPKIDAALRAIPVTKADKIARCERYDNDVPRFTMPKDKPKLLLFEKINGFKDTPSVNAAHAAILEMAKRKGWHVEVTEKGGAFNAKTLKQFDAVIWNNISGDVLSLSQRRAFQRWMEAGGAFVGMHGTAGDPVYFWDWYADTLIGARFAGHPMAPQFQDARIVVDDNSHPAAKALPAEWVMKDEWYSFKNNPRASGARVVLTIDEKSYKPDMPMGPSLRMGDDHPLAWSKCIGKGRMFYSAIGHMPETYVQPQNVALLESAIAWAATEKGACPARP